MTNLALLGPASHSGHAVPHWPRHHGHTTESCRDLQSSSSEAEMPNSGLATSQTSSGTANSFRAKRSQSKEKTRKSTDEKPTPINSPSSDHSEGNNVKQERPTSREYGRVPSTSQHSETGGSPTNASPSPSASPKSPSASRQNRPSSSLSGTPPHPAFTPPTSLSPACFSPVPMGGLGATMPGLPGALGAMGLFNGAQNLPDGVRNMANGMPRNCSDLMRSMAARYNNNNSGLNFYNNPSLNGLHRPPMPPVGFTSSGFVPALPNENSPSPIQAGTGRENNPKTGESSMKRAALGSLPPGLPHHLLSPGAFSGLQANPLMDLSSTQVLINMVRNASNIHQNQLQKTQNEVHNQHQLQKQLIYQQQLHQQQQQQQHQHQQIQQQEAQHLQQQQLQDRQVQKQMKQEELHHSATSPSQGPEDNQRTGVKRPAEAASPLDLSSPVLHKYARAGSETDINVEDDGVSSVVSRASPDPEVSPMSIKTEGRPISAPSKPSFEEKEDSLTWTVDDVYEFVKSIDICAEYAENFKDQRIDGACLSLLSEVHLTGSLKMKLGPALKLRSFLASRVQQQLRQSHAVTHSFSPLSPTRACNHCNNNNNNNNEHIFKKSSYSDSSSGTDQLSPRDQLSLQSPVHNASLLSLHSQSHKENGGSTLNAENRQPAGVD